MPPKRRPSPPRAEVDAEIEALRASELRLRTILRHTPDLILEVDREGRIAFANRPWDVTAPRGEVAAGHDTDAVAPEDRAAVAAARERAWTTGEPADVEVRVLAPDGGTLWWRARYAPVVREGRTTSLLVSAHEITRRKLSEHTVRSAEMRLRDLLDPIGMLAVLVDGQGMVTYCNDHFLSVTGWSRNEVVGRPWLAACVPADTRALVEPVLERAFRSGSVPSHLEHAVATRDGRRRLIAWSHTVLRAPDGAVTALVSLGEDVTDRMMAEAALRAAHEQLEATLRALPDLLFVVDAERRIVDFRAPHVGALVADPGVFLGRPVTEVLPADTAAVLAGALDEADRDGASYGATYSLEMPSGRRWFEASISRRGAAGEAGRQFIALVRDITPQHVAEDRLRASEQLNRTLVDGAGASIALFSPEGRVLLLNPATADLISGVPGEHIGRPMREVPTVLDHKAMAERLAEVVRTGEARQYEDQVWLPSGKRWFVSRWQPQRDRDGALTGIQLIALDVTDRKDAEASEHALAEKLQQTQKLESLGVLAGGIAHDFNNLLSGILGNADLALLDLPPGSEARQPLEQVLQGARRAAELTKQMLAYSGRGRFVTETVSLPDLVAEMGKLLEVSISKKSVLRYEFGEKLPSVDADVAQIRQVVMNLIINASEAIGERSGVIALRVGAAHCGAKELASYVLGESLEAGTYLFVEVEDTGAGMTPDVQARIFEPFYSTKFAGRGLGLAAVLGIVRGHRGALRIDSAPGRGTTFRILLPASSREAAAGGGAAGPLQWRATGTVLVVDDEETVLATGARMLGRIGFRVLTADGGRRALALLDGPDGAAVRVILLDLTMPDLDGEQTYDEIRRRSASVPVVISSGYSEQEVRPRFAGRSAVGFIQKPYGYEALVQAMRTALAS